MGPHIPFRLHTLLPFFLFYAQATLYYLQSTFINVIEGRREGLFLRREAVLGEEGLILPFKHFSTISSFLSESIKGLVFLLFQEASRHLCLGGVRLSLSLFSLDPEGRGSHFGLNVSCHNGTFECTARADSDRVIFFCEDCFIWESVFKSQISFRKLFCYQHQPRQLIMPWCSFFVPIKQSTLIY